MINSFRFLTHFRRFYGNFRWFLVILDKQWSIVCDDLVILDRDLTIPHKQWSIVCHDLINHNREMVNNDH
jgi:hypothetical protein